MNKQKEKLLAFLKGAIELLDAELSVFDVDVVVDTNVDVMEQFKDKQEVVFEQLQIMLNSLNREKKYTLSDQKIENLKGDREMLTRIYSSVMFNLD